MYLTFFEIIEFSLAHCVVSSKSILKCITKLIFCKTNTFWKTLSQNADLTKTISLAEKLFFNQCKAEHQ